MSQTPQVLLAVRNSSALADTDRRPRPHPLPRCDGTWSPRVQFSKQRKIVSMMRFIPDYSNNGPLLRPEPARADRGGLGWSAVGRVGAVGVRVMWCRPWLDKLEASLIYEKASLLFAVGVGLRPEWRLSGYPKMERVKADV